jgi:hypothetical protein
MIETPSANASAVAVVEGRQVVWSWRSGELGAAKTTAHGVQKKFVDFSVLLLLMLLLFFGRPRP